MKRYVTFMIAVMMLAGCREDDQSPPRTFIIPEGYTGWITIEYAGQKNVSASEEKALVLKADSKGRIRTMDSHIHEGWADSEYYYANENSEKTKLNPDKMIHGNASGRESDKKTVQYFFVGTEEQFKKNQYKPERQ